MEIGIYKAQSELERYENELSDILERKNNILEIIDRYDPRVKATKLKEVTVSSSLDTTIDKMSEYVIQKEKYQEELSLIDASIDFYKKEIKRLNKFIEKEIKRFAKYNEWEQKIITMREAGCNWIQIACSVPYSERHCRRIYYNYKNGLKCPEK